MRDLTVLDRFRDMEKERFIYGTRGDSGNGFFKVFVGGKSFLVIASDGGQKRVCEHPRALPASVEAAEKKRPDATERFCMRRV